MRDITLVGAAKTQSAETVTAAIELGVTNIGENYVDEGVAKIEQFLAQDHEHAVAADGQASPVTPAWHFIGRIQGNKTRLIAQHFDWVHTVDRIRTARRLNDQCPPGKTLNILLQVNIDRDPNKGGLVPEECADLLSACQEMANLRLRGLMTILAQGPHHDPTVSYNSMAELHRHLHAQLPQAQAQDWDSLSMGMTADLEAAIIAGATHIRIGTALFGPRKTQP